MVDKKEMFRIMAKSHRDRIIELAGEIEKSHEVVVVKKPAKTLVMLKMFEPVAKSEFFLGEMLACEAMVSIDNRQGMAITQNDDFEKVLSMAIIDAAYNAQLEECGWLNGRLEELKEQVAEDERKEFGRNMKSKVQFRVMEGQ
jgi:alpha-D-ribose 1-methylphosphonate 5-triphosphate synthase subunit PhnG